MFNWLFGGVAKDIAKITDTLVTTDEERANARALILKAIDPNGIMRRQISFVVCLLYFIYNMTIFILTLCYALNFGTIAIVEGKEINLLHNAILSLTDMYQSISTIFGIIVAASFAVNGVNAYAANKK